jgi:hypothetical protein
MTDESTEVEYLPVTWKRAAIVWWAFLWRALLWVSLVLLISFCSAFVVVYGMAKAGVKDIDYIIMVSRIISYTISFPLSVWCGIYQVKNILNKKFDGFRIVLVNHYKL